MPAALRARDVCQRSSLCAQVLLCNSSDSRCREAGPLNCELARANPCLKMDLPQTHVLRPTMTILPA